MIVRLARTLSPWQFAEKYPKAHVVIGHYSPLEQIDEEGSGQPSYFTVLSSAQNGLLLVGECTQLVDMGSATIRLSYALPGDAARVCALVDAVPNESLGDCASLAIFKYDRPLYDKLRAIRDERKAAYRAAWKRREKIEFAYGLGDPFSPEDRRTASPVDDDWGRDSMNVLARIPLSPRPH